MDYDQNDLQNDPPDRSDIKQETQEHCPFLEFRNKHYLNPSDQRLAIAIHTRLEQCQAKHKTHVLYHQLRVYVEEALQVLKKHPDYSIECIH